MCCPGLVPETAGISDIPPLCCTPLMLYEPGQGYSRLSPETICPGGPWPRPGPAHNTWKTGGIIKNRVTHKNKLFSHLDEKQTDGFILT